MRSPLLATGSFPGPEREPRGPLRALRSTAAAALGVTFVGLAILVLSRKEPRAVPIVFSRAQPPAQPTVVAPAEAVPPFLRPLGLPVLGIDPKSLRSNFEEMRGGHRHEAIDILAPRGTPVLAVAEGTVRKLFHSIPGGITVYQYDASESFCFYYAHLDGYAPGLAEGQKLAKGDPVGFVGTTGNAPANTPHLHFAVYKLPPGKEWWKGTPIDPYPLLVEAQASK